LGHVSPVAGAEAERERLHHVRVALMHLDEDVEEIGYLLNDGDEVLVLGVVGGAGLGQVDEGPHPGGSRLGRTQPCLADGLGENLRIVAVEGIPRVADVSAMRGLRILYWQREKRAQLAETGHG
ncbi:hypothetical protein PMAYCL1PPCAC_05411, partial [Pristionchus mayeri]